MPFDVVYRSSDNSNEQSIHPHLEGKNAHP